MRVQEYEQERMLRLYEEDRREYERQTYEGSQMIDDDNDLDVLEQNRLNKMIELAHERGAVRVYCPDNPKSLEPAKVLDIIQHHQDLTIEHRGSDLWVIKVQHQQEQNDVSILDILRENNFVIKRGKQEFVTFKGLLYVAKQHGGMTSMKSEMIREASDFTDNSYVFKATVSGSRGTAEAYGDANPHNVNAMIAPHVLRMAESRAYVRALRFYLGVGLCGMEEIIDDKKD